MEARSRAQGVRESVLIMVYIIIRRSQACRISSLNQELMRTRFRRTFSGLALLLVVALSYPRPCWLPRSARSPRGICSIRPDRGYARSHPTARV